MSDFEAWPTLYRLIGAKPLRKQARSLIAQANGLEPGRNFLILENDMSASAGAGGRSGSAAG